MRLLFVKDVLAYPRTSGHDVHAYHMMRALAELGHEVGLATVDPPTESALAGLRLTGRWSLDEPVIADGWHPRLTGLQERFRSYWGIPKGRIAAVQEAACEAKADAVVVVGLSVLPYLAGVDGRHRIWYAGDEWLWHHLSLSRPTRPTTWTNLKLAFVKGLYERAYASCIDRIWVVSDTDRRVMRWVTGVQAVDVLANGVDSEHFRPPTKPATGSTCVFWGRLDFEPNIQGLEWFCHRVWPQVRRMLPEARFTIYGLRPTPTVLALAALDGVTIIPDLPDIRTDVTRHAVVVLPFVSGGGIKNKLLEAASMGMAIVASPRACNGLALGHPRPLVVAQGVRAWTRAIARILTDEPHRAALGAAARRYAVTEHDWCRTARRAVASLAPAASAAAMTHSSPRRGNTCP
jgi:glycosyltransferase involved in cell wall biosynthesis